MNIGRKILIGLMVVNAYSLILDLLKIMDIVKINDYHTKGFNIVYSMVASIAILTLFKNTYWIAAGIFGLLHSIGRIVSAFLYKSYHDIYNIPILLIMVTGMICLLASSYFYYRLFNVKEFNFEDNIRLNDLYDYLKKKFRSVK